MFIVKTIAQKFFHLLYVIKNAEYDVNSLLNVAPPHIIIGTLVVTLHLIFFLFFQATGLSTRKGLS